jgi:hypothetical protein
MVFRKLSSSKAQERMYGYRIDWEEGVTMPARAA